MVYVLIVLIALGATLHQDAGCYTRMKKCQKKGEKNHFWNNK
jgi:hypothetical protein